MGTAVLLSVLFTLMPTNITGAMQNESTLKPALTAALTRRPWRTPPRTRA